MPSTKGTMHKQLKFKVCYCEVEDPDFPAVELNVHKPETKGWQSQIFAEFPVELGLRFEDGLVQVSQLQILSHEDRIATKIEVFIGTGESYQDAKFKRLGYLSLDNNERSNFTARELKSVYISASGKFLKLMVHKCHPNQRNITNKVGIIAINVLGQNIQESKTASNAAPIHTNQYDRENVENGPRDNNQQDHTYNSAGSRDNHPSSGAVAGIRRPGPTQDLAFHMQFDQATVRLLRDVSQAKQLAVEEENYEKAKHLKDIENELKAVGAQVVQLEAQKAAAVRAEDYDTAAILKHQIQQLRADIDEEAMQLISGGETRQHHSDNQQLPPPGNGYYQTSSAPQYARHQQIHRPEDIVIHRHGRAHEMGIKSPADAPQSPQKHPRFPDIHNSKRGSALDGSHGPASLELAGHPPRGVDDNRPLPALSNNNNSHRGLESSEPFGANDLAAGGASAVPSARSQQSGFGNELITTEQDPIASSGGGVYLGSPGRRTPRRDEIIANGGEDPLEGVPGAEDLTEPDEIPASMLNDAQQMIRVFGDYIVRCLYSRNVKLRTAAVQKVEYDLEKGKFNPSASETLAAIFSLVRVAINDKIAPYVAGLRLLTTSLEQSQAGQSNNSSSSVANHETPRKSQIHSGLDAILPVIVDKLGDNNTRVRDGSRDILIQLAQMDGVGANFVATSIVRKQKRTSKTSNLWKPVMERLVVMKEIVRSNGVSDHPHSPLSLSQIMQLIADCLGHSHPNIEVRDAARDLTMVAYRSAITIGQNPWPIMEEYLVDLRPKQLEDYNARLEKIDQELNYKRDEATNANTAPAPSPDRTPRGTRRRQHAPSSPGAPAASPSNRNGNRDSAAAGSPKSPRTTGRSGEPSSPPPPKKYEQKQNRESRSPAKAEFSDEEEELDEPFTCQFCLQHNPDFTEEQLDLHYWRECPMLTGCPQCEQVIEVSMLNEHLLSECEKKDNHRRCPRCGEAIALRYFEQHANRNNCKEFKPLNVASRCPLCHKDIPPDLAGWREHLLGGNGCPKNARTAALV